MDSHEKLWKISFGVYSARSGHIIRGWSLSIPTFEYPSIHIRHFAAYHGLFTFHLHMGPRLAFKTDSASPSGGCAHPCATGEASGGWLGGVGTHTTRHYTSRHVTTRHADVRHDVIFFSFPVHHRHLRSSFSFFCSCILPTGLHPPCQDPLSLSQLSQATPEAVRCIENMIHQCRRRQHPLNNQNNPNRHQK